ncbi:MAG: glycerol kinase GlpK [Firmicutes bacterium]|nr:glycerol kinase GlpK [Bacillota bacterium]
MVFDSSGRLCAQSQHEFRQIFPQPGWVEHDPMDIWHSQLQAAREALAQLGADPGSVAAVGITNQRETTLLWDRRTGQPVSNAVVWQCRRTAALCNQLCQAGYEPLFRQKTGLVLDPYFSGTKLKWLLDHIPGARRRAASGELAFGTVDAWLLWNLTGGRVHATDCSNASRTLLFNLHTQDWDDELLEALAIPRPVLPEVYPSQHRFGTTDPDLFGAPIPILGMAGDQQAALFGQTCFAPGAAKNTYGTGCFLLLNTGAQPISSRHGLLTTVAWCRAGRATYALEGSVFVAGAVVQWLRDQLHLVRHAADTAALAASVPDTGDVFLVPAFTGLGAPYWDSRARGTLVGVTRGTTAAHIVRAALEAIAYQTRDVLAAMEADAAQAGEPDHAGGARAEVLRIPRLRVDGGASANDFLMQFQADILGVPVERPAFLESTALGAAYLAGLEAGLWDRPEALAARRQVDRVFQPAMDEAQRERLYGRWRQAVERAREWTAESPDGPGENHG